MFQKALKECPRCHRFHSGVCGIPYHSTLRHPGLARPLALAGPGAVVPLPRRKATRSMPLVQQVALQEAQATLGLAIGRIKGIEESNPDYETLFADLERCLDRVAVLKMDTQR